MGRRSRERKERIIAGLEQPRGLTAEQKAERRKMNDALKSINAMMIRNPVLGFALAAGMLKSARSRSIKGAQ